jgi:ABC-type uncharacterized transport system permease subunit
MDRPRGSRSHPWRSFWLPLATGEIFAVVFTVAMIAGGEPVADAIVIGIVIGIASVGFAFLFRRILWQE